MRPDQVNLTWPHHATAQPVFLWWMQICNRLTEAAMFSAAYNVIHTHTNPAIPGEAASWMDCKVSNYHALNADGRVASLPAEGIFHYQRTDTDASPFPPATTAPTTAAIHAVP